MKLRRASVILIMLSALFVLSAVQCDAFLYAGKRKRINCGIVRLYSGSQPLGTGASGGVGELFYLLDLLTDMKPAGWTSNPLAPGSPSTGLGKNDPVYWQVDLRAATDLSRMNVLYLPASGDVTLSIQDRDKLRQFVDSGGVLWIDNAGTGGSQLNFENSFFIPELYFESATNGSDYPISRHHPLLSLPYWLNDQEIAMLGSNWGQSVCHPGYDVGGVAGWDQVGEEPATFDVLYPIVANSSLGREGSPSVAANAYGSGRIVATSGFVGKGCYLNYPFSLPSLKFAYDMITWASSWTHLRKDPRHSGASIDAVGGTKLLKFWSLPVSASNSGESAPVIYKNVVFYSSGNTLFALDLMPQEDLDQDGNPDDGDQGTRNLANEGQDVIWASGDLGGPLSAPSVVTIQDPSNPNASKEAVLVQSLSGQVTMLEAFPTDGPSHLAGNPVVLYSFNVPTFTGASPCPPLYVNGWIYAVGGDGRLYAKNPSLEKWNDSGDGHDAVFKWELPSLALNTGSAEPRTGPSFGYVKNESNGATVGVVQWYAGYWNTPTGDGTSVNQTDHVYSAPVFVCNDRIRIENTDSTGLVSEARVTYREALIAEYPKVKIDIPGIDSDLITVVVNARLNNTETPEPPAAGYLRITTPVAIPTDALIYATYGLVYARNNGDVSYSAHQKTLEPRSQSGVTNIPITRFAGMPAMGSDSMLFLSGRRNDAGVGPSVYGLYNDGSTQTSRWIFHMYDGIGSGMLGGATLPPGFSDLPGAICGVMPSTDSVADPEGHFGVMGNPQIRTSPAISGDKVFVTVSGNPSAGAFTANSPGAALVCFKANPDFVIRLTENAGYDSNGQAVKRAKKLVREGTGQEMQVKIWQPNLFDGGSSLAVPPTMGAIPVRRDMIDYQRGTITFNNFDQLKLRGGPGNVMQTNTFSPSLPVWVYVDNVEVPIDFGTWAPAKRMQPTIPPPTGDSVDLSAWNNMLWYYPVPKHPDGAPCSGISSSPVVIGSTVYFVCNDGYMFALPTETGENSGGPIDPKLLIWEELIEDAGTANPQDGPDMSVAASNGVLVVPTPSGLHAYTNATTLIADGSRVVEMDGAGEVRWGIDTISWPVARPTSTNDPAPVTTGPISKPSRAVYLTSGDILIVNSGANQVCKVDRTGTAGVGGMVPNYTRGIYDKFIDPRNLLTPGQPLSLASPTDALYWQEYEKQLDGETTLRVDHCVIADSGNNRIIDLVYRYNWDVANGRATALLVSSGQTDPNTGFVLPELNWVTATSTTSEKYTFDSIQLVTRTDGEGQDIYAAVSNYRASLSSTQPLQTEGLGGAIFAICYRVGTPQTGWDYADPLSGRITSACDRVNRKGTVMPLACPRYVQVVDRLTSGAPGRFLLICDNYGVYEVGPLGAANPPVAGRSVSDGYYRDGLPREILNEDGNGLPPVPLGIPLFATSVQELPNGNWLITNGYSGSNTAGTASFTGEVVEVTDWQGDGTPAKVNWSSPPIYHDTTTGQDSQKLQNGYILQQPRSAQRQL